MGARRLYAAACLLVALAPGCQPAGRDAAATDSALGAGPSPASPAATEVAGSQVEHRPPRVVFLGDSLTAGYGVDLDEAFPAVIGRLLAAEGRPIEVINAGISGDTSAGGLARTAWTLRTHADVLVLCLGGNDGLRGQSPANTADNLRRIIALAKAAGTSVLLVGVQLPPDYGPEHTAAFAAIYPALARETGVPFVTSLLEGVGGRPELNQADGIHPTAEGQRLAAGNVLPALREVLAGL
ncbi:MAG TPA: arylesterase [Planctomycetota bacterium]|nr:arylesterase [Planctomycetota bacterium]